MRIIIILAAVISVIVVGLMVIWFFNPQYFNPYYHHGLCAIAIITLVIMGWLHWQEAKVDEFIAFCILKIRKAFK